MNYEEIFKVLQKSDFEEVMKALVKWGYAVNNEEVLQEVADYTLDNLEIDYLLHDKITDKIWELDGHY